jgi:RNA polymerase primary sigma factor
VHIIEKLCHIRRATFHLQELLGREPNDAEVASEMHLPAREIARVRNASVRPASLDAPLGDEDAGRLADVIRDENAASPYECLEEKNSALLLVGLVDKLSAREASVVRYRFGLDGGKERTLKEVGEKFAITRERVRQLQNMALAKLRRMIQRVEDPRFAA